jgi:alpha/beta hydrolase fold
LTSASTWLRASSHKEAHHVNAAIDFISAHADQYGIDADRVGVWGESAGAHLALMAAMTNPHVQAAVAWYPLTDIAALDIEFCGLPESLWLGLTVACADTTILVVCHAICTDRPLLPLTARVPLPTLRDCKINGVTPETGEAEAVSRPVSGPGPQRAGVRVGHPTAERPGPLALDHYAPGTDATGYLRPGDSLPSCPALNHFGAEARRRHGLS